MTGGQGATKLAIAAWVSIAVSLFLVFLVAREADDAMGGQLQRIFYFHVSSAWAAYLAFAVTFIGSVAYLRTSNRKWDLLAHSSAEIGVLFTTIVLVTGPIWARPVWGTWWQWDARLTSAFVMWLTYLGYLFLRALSTDPTRTGRVAAVVGIVGLINVPIVHFSVQWWRTLHPTGPTPADLVESSGLGSPELTAFFSTLIAITLLYAWMLMLRVRLGRLADRIEELEIEQARPPQQRQPTAFGEPAPTA
ncbi:MAG: cytochrome c biogenesis protein [Actinomycetota bacterium]